MCISLLLTIPTALAEGGYSDSGGCEMTPSGCLCLGVCLIFVLMAAAKG